MDPRSQKQTPSASASALAAALAGDEPANMDASSAVQGVLRHPRRGMSPRLLPVPPRRHSVDYESMPRSVPRQRYAHFASPLQRETVIGPPARDFGVDVMQRERAEVEVEKDEVVMPFEDTDAQYATPEWEAPRQNADERTRLLATRDRLIGQTGHGTITPSTEGSDSRMRQSSDFDDAAFEDDDPVFQKSVCMLGFSIIMITSVVFVIIVSGLTTLIARRAVPRFTVATDWPNGAEIPLKYGCLAPGGKPESFPLTWRNVPPSATNLVVLFANPGAISKKGIDPVHWFVTDIPVRNKAGKAVYQLPANASLNEMLMPYEAKQRANVHSKSGVYYPPCPTRNSSLFVMHVYAIDASPVIDNFDDARKIMNRFVGVPTARYSGTYGTSHRDIQVIGKPGTHSASAPRKEGNGKSTGYHEVHDFAK